ncbi:hypothetical protein CYMTET_55788, partial [Cymbomonas tetramitiformis]
MHSCDPIEKFACAEYEVLLHWLQSLGLEKYASTFAMNGLFLPQLRNLAPNDLVALRLPLGPRRKLLAAIAVLPPEVCHSAEANSVERPCPDVEFLTPLPNTVPFTLPERVLTEQVGKVSVESCTDLSCTGWRREDANDDPPTFHVPQSAIAESISQADSASCFSKEILEEILNVENYSFRLAGSTLEQERATGNPSRGDEEGKDVRSLTCKQHTRQKITSYGRHASTLTDGQHSLWVLTACCFTSYDVALSSCSTHLDSGGTDNQFSSPETVFDEDLDQ